MHHYLEETSRVGYSRLKEKYEKTLAIGMTVLVFCILAGLYLLLDIIPLPSEHHRIFTNTLKLFVVVYTVTFVVVLLTGGIIKLYKRIKHGS